MNTYWTYTVHTSLDGRDGVSVMGAGDTYADAMAKAITDATYYAIVCGYETCIDDVAERCHECDGAGVVTVTTKRAQRRKVCPSCRGKVSAPALPTIAFRLHRQARELIVRPIEAGACDSDGPRMIGGAS